VHHCSVLPALFARGLAALLGVVAAAAHAAPSCSLGQLAELPVTMNGARPMVHSRINGADALLIADSGAFFSFLTVPSAAEYKLALLPVPSYLAVHGVGGDSRQIYRTQVKAFTIFDVQLPDVEFLVLSDDLGAGAAGLLGQNVFRIADVEYDLANGVIRLIRPKDCKNAPLAYWAHRGQPYSVVDIDFATPLQPHTQSIAYLNGSKIRVLFDTGSPTSLLTLSAARRVGVTPQSPGVVPGGTTGGIGKKPVPTWIAPFGSFKIGDEEIRNTKLRVGDTASDVDMLIGADFFLSHRIFVASSQRKLYFTYNGGPVFDLSSHAASGNAGATEASGVAAPEASAQPAAPELGDAAAFARRGAASAARHAYGPALADLTRACELAPTEASYFYMRGVTHRDNQEPELALADFDVAIKLKPDEVDALLARARMRALRHDPAETIIPDLEAADRATPPTSPTHLDIGSLYLLTQQFPPAVAQYSKWIDSRPGNDPHMPEILNLRCWIRAMAGQELEQALDDCDRAIRQAPGTARYLESRGLVRLRRQEYDQALTDYDAALKLTPTSAWGLLGRGIGRLHTGRTLEGQADIAAATRIDPELQEVATELGLH
jgi:Flp pilus assembly protein TadD